MSTMAQAPDALFNRKWMSEEEQDELQTLTQSPALTEDKFTSSSFAAALKAIAERNRLVQPEFAQPAFAQSASAPASAKAAALKISEIEDENEEEIEQEEYLPRVKKAPALARAWTWLKKRRVIGVEKQLKLSETLSLGEKRFVAILNVEGRKFLIGGGSTGVSLLTQLEDAPAISKSVPARGVR